ncbi:MAG TPA: chemotaxis protein CheW [Conexibacter sp.]|jgi:purine-binding chemotaxis protein CheW|nr:chemotaxis protein CheW [Conexibacter sp.]
MPTATDTDTSQLVVCALGDEEYGLPVGQVREIVRYSEPRPVASDVPWMRGVVSLRGRLVPVHDLAARLGLVSADATVPPPAAAKLVIVETADEPIGVLVDDVVEVLTIDAAQLEPVPSGSGQIARVGERLVLLLDGEELGS